LTVRALYEPGATDASGVVTDAAKQRVLKHVGMFFRPELINRLDELLVFNKLPPSMIKSIVELRLAEIQTRLNPKRVHLDITESAKDWLAVKGYSEEYGARAVARIVRDKVANPVASGLLDGHIR
jgi:ATP-dependent Clp protease ATP-binding subunit ClpB